MGDQVRCINGCEVNDTGVCSYHGVEVERRKNSEALLQHVPGMMTRINTMIGYSILATILILGAFYYTQETRADSKAGDKKLEEKIEQVAGQVSELTTAVARNEEKHSALISRLDTLTEYMRILIINAHDNKSYSEPYPIYPDDERGRP